MPVVGVNVLQNPDWTDLTAYGKPYYWTTDATWDPLLAYGCGGAELNDAFFGTDGGLEVLGANSLRVDWARATQLDPATEGYAGLLYAGEGFDGVPGDSWRIQFTATRRSFPSNYVLPGSSLGNTTDLLVRIGIIVPDGDSWISYTMNLPAYANAISAGAVVAYDETFEIPSDWPEGIYQFAVVTTGNPTLPVNSTYRYGLREDFENFSLEYVSSGGGSPGPAGVASPYVDWPVPRWAAGSPVCDPPLCTGEIEWDPWNFRAPLTSAHAISAGLPHTSPSGPTVPGTDETLVYIAEFNPFDGWTANGQDSDDLDKFPISCDGEFCIFLALFYTVVPWREYQFSALSGGLWVAVREFKPLLCHPSSLGGRVDGRGRDTVPWGPPAPVPDDDAALFCFTGCQNPPAPGPIAQPIYLTHEVGPGDANVPAGSTGGLNLRGARVGPGEEGGSAGTGSAGIHLGGIKGQP